MTNKEGIITGLSTEIVEALLKKLSINYKISIYPWARALLVAKDGENSCVYSTSRIPEREKDYKWIGPIVTNEWVIFKLKSNPKNIKSLDNIRGDIIGSYVGDAIVKYLEDLHFKVDTTRADNHNPLKLQKGHIAYWATGKLLGLYILREQKITDIIPTFVFNKTEMYLACNKNLPDFLAKEMQTQLHKMNSTGEIKKIFQKYGYEQ